MAQLIKWLNTDSTTPPMIRVSIFIYDFLSIHPFQDGNGRLSRLLATLLLLRQGYSWIQYVSFEHEIESRKAEYYSALMQCQRERPGEDVYAWVGFFLNCLANIQQQLMQKLQGNNSLSQLSPRGRKIFTFIENHPGCQSGEISEKLDIPLPTVKRILMEMSKRKLLVKHGTLKATNYTIETIREIETNLMFTLRDNNRRKEVLLATSSSFLEIKKIILAPLFPWKDPNDWGTRLLSQNVGFKITCIKNGGGRIEIAPRFFIGLISLYHFNPVVTLMQPINVAGKGISGFPLKGDDYPLKVIVEIVSDVPNIDFDIRFVYDAILD